MKVLKTINLKGYGKKYSGKVRDFYIVKDPLRPALRRRSREASKRILIATDRVSAFDKVLGYIPYKGQVLNDLSAFWFNKTADIVDNHMLSIPDPNVMIVRNCKIIPIEMVVRGYITGVTGTSLWRSYEKGERTIYGIEFPQGLKKNQKLARPVITPTTKARHGHDERLTQKEIIQKGIVSQKLYAQIAKAALHLFARGQNICTRRGLILVDTKYEFGIYNGRLMLVDEIHTPDSSRFWIKKTYQKRFKKDLEPENFDKEFLRIWFKNHGYTGEGNPPKMPASVIWKVSKRYRDVYKILTGKRFVIHTEPIQTRIKKNIQRIHELL